MILTTVKHDRMLARKNDPVRYKVLTVVLGEVERSLNKVKDDDLLIKVLLQLINSAKETYDLTKNQELLDEIVILESYIPKVELLSDEELTNIVSYLKNNKGMKLKGVHVLLNNEYSRRYNKKDVNGIYNNV